MSSSRYKQAYNKLGDERVQSVSTQMAPSQQARGSRRNRDASRNMSAYDQFWALRMDETWSRLPGFFRFNRRTGVNKFTCTIPHILVHLEPANTFNPAEVWEKEIIRMEQESKEKNVEEVVTKKEKGKSKEKAISAGEQIILSNKAAKIAERLLKEVTRIRNSKNLLSLVRELRVPEARCILMVEILKQAYDDFKKTKEKKLLFEVLWALEGQQMYEQRAPMPTDKKALLVKDPSLLYDNYADIEKLLKKARKVMSQEEDMIRLQLMEMSDSLPPLSKFTFGFRLDPWQKRVLGWIDAGKSVVICAPTSSGKTVLSSYVAIIFKSNLTADAGKKRENDDTEEVVRKVAKLEIKDEDEEVDEEDDDDAGGWEEQEDEDEIDQDEQQGTQNETAQTEEDEEFTESSYLRRAIEEDRKQRKYFASVRKELEGGKQRILFVVPTEPLVWQVSAYFTKLLLEEGDQETKVGIITDHLTYHGSKKFNIQPQIVVGTPLSLETALTKPRGLVGMWESFQRIQGDILPGGFDHFDWVIYDEVHALDGPEGAALQRLIRSMNCKFLALSATVGNAEELRSWFERVKGDQINGLEAITAPGMQEIPKSTPVAAKSVELKPESESKTSGMSIEIIRTLSFESTVISGVSENTTIRELMILIEKQWPDLLTETGELPPHAKQPYQLVFEGVDMGELHKDLKSYGVLGEGAKKGTPAVYLRSHVHLLVHQGRFINLQRYIWSEPENQNKGRISGVTGGVTGSLQTVSPLLAVESVEALKNGILRNSSLSFTSRDSFRMWELIKKIFPSSSTTVNKLDPYRFFGEKERITLQRTKDYEDLLKSGLQALATEFPVETQELLYSSQIKDPPKEFDLCDMVLDLKARDMTPCLPFHLNTFEAIRLFQHLLGSLEWRQKNDFPTYHLDQALEKDARRKETEAKVQSTGKNEKALEEAMKAGEIDTSEDFTVDEYAPHPNYVLSKGMPLSELELTNLVHEMERNDGFEKRDASAIKNSKGKNQYILRHALIRGLRRGIGLFIDEVSFPSYRRAVQRLASRGKLAVVISDGSLAFGVNMPFRTCVFCGEMFGELDELMAQQMSGRAGRRGLDTQGNLLYAGVRVSHIRRLMIGTVSNITGQNYHPRYPSMFLQPLLAPRHVGWSRAETLGGRSLQEFVSKSPPLHDHYTMELSRAAMTQLGFITLGPNNRFIPNPDRQVTFGLLSIIWSLREKSYESISIGLMFPDIVEEFSPLLGTLSLNEKKQSSDVIERIILNFFTIFVLIFDRTPWEPTNNPITQGDDNEPFSTKLQDLPYFQQTQHREFLDEWSQRFRDMQESIPVPVGEDTMWAQGLRDPVGPDVDLDGTFFQCVLDRNFVHTLDEERKQKMKKKIWYAGSVLKILQNCSWPEDEYIRTAYFLLRTGFSKLKYLNSELIRGVINFGDVSAAEREKRVDSGSAGSVPLSKKAMPWSDNKFTEESNIFPLSWATAIERCVERCEQLKLNKDSSNDLLNQELSAFYALKPSDLSLVKLLLNFSATDTSEAYLQFVASAVNSCSFGDGGIPNGGMSDPAMSKFGVLTWLCLVKCPKAAGKFLMYLKTMYDEGLVEEKSVRLWYEEGLEPALFLPYVPSSYHAFSAPGGAQGQAGLVSEEENPLKIEELVKLKNSSRAIFINYLDNQDDEEEDDDDDDEED